VIHARAICDIFASRNSSEPSGSQATATRLSF
jgi:hypothetical protein